MLEQQNLLNQCSQQKQSHTNSVINIIDHEASRFKNLVAHLRLNRKRSSSEYPSSPFQLQNQSEISNIDHVSQKIDKNSFQLDLPTDFNYKKKGFTTSPNVRDKNSNKDIGDQGLKYKPRSNVNGRDDIRIRNVNQIQKQIVASLDKRKNQSQSIEKEFGNTEQMLSRISQTDNPENNGNHLFKSLKLKSPLSNLQQKLSKRQSQTQRLNRTSGAFQNTKQGKNGNKLSQIFVQIEGKDVLKYLKNIKKSMFPSSDAAPSKIYQFFMELCSNFGIQSNFNEPLIKRYRNCIYFGQKISSSSKSSQNQSYSGFVWYFRRALYYGQFQKGRKNGYGTQIDFQEEENQSIWRGTFSNGKKTGFFVVHSNKLQYHGSLVNSYFDGQGMLITKDYSTYKGNFQAGMKHGFGVQHFQNSKSLNYKGQYFENKFQGSGQLQGPNYFYKGQFKSNKPHGTGFERTDQFQYSGQFRNGKKSGKGILKMKNGQQLKGFFENGKLVNEIDNPSKASIQHAQKNGNKYDFKSVTPAQNQQNQYTKSIKIRSFKQNQQTDSLQPSSILSQQNMIKFPLSSEKKSLPVQSFFSLKQCSPYQFTPSQNQLLIIQYKQPFSNKPITLQKHLSKRLNSLYEQNQFEQATMENDRNFRGAQKYQIFRQNQIKLIDDNDQQEPLQIKVLGRE